MCFKFIPRSTVTKARLQSFICLPIVSKWDQYIDGNETSSFSKLNPRYGVGIIIKCSVLSSVRGNEGGGGVRGQFRNADNANFTESRKNIKIAYYVRDTYCI